MPFYFITYFLLRLSQTFFVSLKVVGYLKEQHVALMCHESQETPRDWSVHQREKKKLGELTTLLFTIVCVDLS